MAGSTENDISISRLPQRVLMAVGVVFWLGIESAVSFLRHVYRISSLVGATVIRLPLFAKNLFLSVEQMYGIGIESLPLVSITALFIGAVTVTQAVYQFAGLIPLKYLGVAVCKGLTNEIAPVLTTLIVSGRVTTAIAAEIGSMKSSEQLDAMQCLSLDSIRYLIVPKMIACVIMMPILVIWAELLAFVGSIITVIFTVDVTLYVYTSGLKLFFSDMEVLIGIGKTAVFGAIIAMTGSHFGFEARGGAEGVGNATTKAVMTSCVLILVFDFIIALLVL